MCSVVGFDASCYSEQVFLEDSLPKIVKTYFSLTLLKILYPVVQTIKVSRTP